MARMSAATAAAANAQNPASAHITPDQALQLLQSLGYNAAASTAASTASAGTDALGFSIPASVRNGVARLEGAFSGDGNHLPAHGFTFNQSDQQQRSTFSPFSPASNVHPLNGADQQQQSATPPSQPLPHPSRSYAPGFGPSAAACSGKYSDTNSPHSTSTDSSSGSSSVRFSGIPGSSGRFSTSAFLDNPGTTFQVSDILRHDSQTLFPRLSMSASSSSQAHPQSQDSSGRKTQHQEQGQAGVHVRDDTGGSEFMHDLNGTLASLDLGERYPRVTIGSDMLMKDRYGRGNELRPLSSSVSAPLESFVTSRPNSGGSPDDT